MSTQDVSDETPGSLERPDYAALVGVALAASGTVLPWAVTADGTTAGLESNGFVAIIASFAVLAVVVVMRGSESAYRAALIGGFLITLLAGHYITIVAGFGNAGGGVVITLVGGLVALAGGAIGLYGSHDDA